MLTSVHPVPNVQEQQQSSLIRVNASTAMVRLHHKMYSLFANLVDRTEVNCIVVEIKLTSGGSKIPPPPTTTPHSPLTLIVHFW